MRMLDRLNSKQAEIARLGTAERMSAHADGVSSFYSDDARSGVVEERPDGSKELHSSFSSALKTGVDAAE